MLPVAALLFVFSSALAPTVAQGDQDYGHQPPPPSYPAYPVTTEAATSILTGVTRETPYVSSILTGVTQEISYSSVLTGVTRETPYTSILTGVTRESSSESILTGVTRESSAESILTGVTRESLTSTYAPVYPTTPLTHKSILTGVTRETSVTTATSGETNFTSLRPTSREPTTAAETTGVPPTQTYSPVSGTSERLLASGWAAAFFAFVVMLF